MPTKLGTILRQATRKDEEPLNVLTFLAHERYQSMMANTNDNFYFLEQPHNLLKWNETYEPIPFNCFFINPRNIPVDIDFDLILCPAKRYALDARKYSLSLFLPILNLEVFVPDINRNPKVIKGIHNRSRGDLNVFIDDYCRQVWQWPKDDKTYEIIPHGISTEIFHDNFNGYRKENQILTVANDFIKRDWSHGYSIWKEVTEGLSAKVIGNTPGLSKAVTVEELIKEMQSAAIYLNTTLEVPVPTSMMEAMSCGCPVVALDTGGIKEIIRHGFNGFLAKDIKELKGYIQDLLNDKDMRYQLGCQARETITEQYPMKKFTEKWRAALRKTANMAYTGDLHAN